MGEPSGPCHAAVTTAGAQRHLRRDSCWADVLPEGGWAGLRGQGSEGADPHAQGGESGLRPLTAP